MGRIEDEALDRFFSGTGAVRRSVRSSDRVPSSTEAQAKGRKGATMATVVRKKSGSSKKGGAAAKSTAAKKNGAGTRAGRGEVAGRIEKDAKNIAKRLKDGGKMKAEKERFGLSSDVVIVRTLAKAGFNSKGGKLDVPEVGDVEKAAGKKRLVALRKDGTPWYVLEIATGVGETELKRIVEAAGGPTGRVYRQTEGDAAGR